ncbi:MAG: hypothetical protein KA175_10645 [Flavobacteriales bacterium]|nr:hypothetical protein [Flavobacteriales bacterium]MBP6698067.1 hypothetical protein [Flavobacteriales bacterium]
MRLSSLLTIALLCASLTTMAGKPITFIKGDKSIFKGDASFLVEWDMSLSSIDALDTEEAFIDYYKGKEKDPEKWENGWKKDKAGFLNAYVESLARDLKKTKLKVSSDDPESKYKMIVRPMKMKTGTPMRYSAIEMKLHVIDMASQEEVAIIHVPEVMGVKWSMMTPTLGMTVNYAVVYSARYMAKFVQKTIAGK